jgi:hypothetical protein
MANPETPMTAGGQRRVFFGSKFFVEGLNYRASTISRHRMTPFADGDRCSFREAHVARQPHKTRAMQLCFRQRSTEARRNSVAQLIR